MLVHFSVLLLAAFSHAAQCSTNNDTIELLISYHGYFNADHRQSIINEALTGGKLSNVSFSLQPRPLEFSDFDVVEFPHPLLPSLSDVLRLHSQVRHVGPHQLLRFSELKRRKVRPGSETVQVTQLMRAQELWDMGLKGQGVRVGVFDTGLPESHPHFRDVIERTDWTNERTSSDGLGHGTFVAGVIAGSFEDCPGFAPAASLYIYKVFTKKQVSYTSWFLDAFNHAIMRGINIINLSIGGPDFTDRPFMDKVWELTANGIILISAIGNDGPNFGTLNNPADQMDVIGVGGINAEGRLARFSSRGMTIWELPQGYGRAKPDVVSYGASVLGSALDGRCRSLSGTSVASPVVSGAVALMLSGIEDRSLWNAGVVKQALMEGATRLPEAASIFEQGAGRVDLLKAFKFLRKYKPQITLFPSHLDSLDCPYLWPFCADPLYAGALPKIINVTIISGLAVSSRIEDPPVWEPFNSDAADRLKVAITFSPQIWPWTGFMALHLSVRESSSNFTGTVTGRVRLTVVSDHFGQRRRASIAFPMRLRIIATPPRSQRVLWDQYRNLRYPPGYIPRDDLREKSNPLDWNGDHPHTNFRLFFQHLRTEGFFLEISGSPLTCIDLSAYSVYIVVDPEEEYFPTEIDRIRTAVDRDGLNVIVLADWYNTEVMEKIKFFDENSKEWWTPETGGANVPALNTLLAPWGIALDDRVIEGNVTIRDLHSSIRSGSSIARAPEGAFLAFARVTDITDEMITGDAAQQKNIEVPVFALVRGNKTGSGFISVLGDSSCLESKAASVDSCIPLVDLLIDAAAYGVPLSFCEHLTQISSAYSLPSSSSLPTRKGNGRHFAVLSSVVLAFQGDEILYHDVPPCRLLPPSFPRIIDNFTFPPDVTDRSHDSFGRIVSSFSSDGRSLGPPSLPLPSVQMAPHPGVAYIFVVGATIIILVVLIIRICRLRITRGPLWQRIL